jgi:hypothetical protein
MINIQTLNANNSIVRKQNFAIQYMDYCTEFFLRSPVVYSTNPGKILAVDYTELASHTKINWSAVNVIFAETVQQIYDYRVLLDKNCSYIFVTESWCDLDSLRKKFAVNILDHCTIFNEVMDYGRELFQFESHLAAIDLQHRPTPEYDFFCLIGRRSNLRSSMINQLAQLDMSQSLIKYHGQVLNNSAATDCDNFSYEQHNFYNEYHVVQFGLTLLSKLVQPQFYNRFRFEVQVETDPYGEHMGWDLQEFHVTEKTLKPLIMNKPCLMLGPCGYHAWLATHGIDLGHRNFDVDQFDCIEHEHDRMLAMVKLLKQTNFKLVQPSVEQHVHNLAGLHSLADVSKSGARRFEQLIRTHG